MSEKCSKVHKPRKCFKSNISRFHVHQERHGHAEKFPCHGVPAFCNSCDQKSCPKRVNKGCSLALLQNSQIDFQGLHKVPFPQGQRDFIIFCPFSLSQSYHIFGDVASCLTGRVLSYLIIIRSSTCCTADLLCSVQMLH